MKQIGIFRKSFYIISGIIVLSIATIGIVVPGIPTTPLLLLTLYCFGKSSERLTQWFKRTQLYKKYLAEYVQKKAMTLKQKLIIQFLASIMMAISFVTIHNWVFRIVISLLFFIHHYIFIFRIKTYKPGTLENESTKN